MAEDGGVGSKGSRGVALTHPSKSRGLDAGLPLRLSDSGSLCLPLCSLPFSSPHRLTLPVSLLLSLCPSPCPPLSHCLSLSAPLTSSRPYPIPSGVAGPWAGPSAGQGPGDDRLLPLAAARRGLRVATVRGHRGHEREEPWRAPRALGQLRAQVRFAPLSSPTGSSELPPEDSASSAHLRVGALQGGLLEKDRCGQWW